MLIFSFCLNTVSGVTDSENQYKKSYNVFFKRDYYGSIKIANDIIKKDKNFYKAYNIKGIALSYLGDYKNGLQNINKSLKIHPKFGYALFNKALTYELVGRYNTALYWYDQDLKIEKYVWSYYGKASIYGRYRDVKNAVKYLRLAIKIDPYVKKAAKTEEDFNSIRNCIEFKNLLR
jgi:tetratricopeptide (TPR) repeat protein